MPRRDQLDKKAWAVLASRTPLKGRPSGFAASGRPANFAELATAVKARGNYAHAWSEFLHEFYRYRTPDFFTVEPRSQQFSAKRRALLAAVAETLSIRFGLPVPEWTQKSKYILHEPWDPEGELYPGMPIEERLEYAGEIFRKHNVVFKERSLITL